MKDMLKIDDRGLVGDTIPNMKKCEKEIELIYDEMGKVVRSLQNYMEAEAAVAYVNEFETLVGPSVKEMEGLINRYHVQLEKVVEHFKESDLARAKVINAQ